MIRNQFFSASGSVRDVMSTWSALKKMYICEERLDADQNMWFLVRLPGELNGSFGASVRADFGWSIH
jgi:hypothetical protein